MKILIIGNGFDLAHYLPTAYAHFMGVMAAIEKLPIEKLPKEKPAQVTYDDLFSELANLERNKDAFSKTREIYDGDHLKFDVDKVYEIKDKLKNNKWYAFFKKHMEINTWIDFEGKIYGVLEVVFDFYKAASNIKIKSGRFGFSILDYKRENVNRSDSLFLDRSNLEVLLNFGLLVKDKNHTVIHDSYRVGESGYVYDVKLKEFTDFLYSQIFDFSNVFKIYLLLICSSFLKKKFNFGVVSGVFDGLDVSRVYSFNYTSTLLDLYVDRLKGEGGLNFLHGSVSKGDIVLGVDGLDKNFLNNFGLYGFLKHHQKLFFDTDYLFLEQDETLQSYIKNDGHKLQIYVWGHSMDVSDGDYVRELFSFPDAKVLLVVFYFGNAKFDLLANLLKIVGKEKIERWMKKGWLKFEKAPDLYELNFKKKDEPSV